MVLASIQARINKMKQKEHGPVSDTTRVLEFLKRRPYDSISEVEISRQAGGESRFALEPNWAQTALSRLLVLQMVETDGSRNYRLKTTRDVPEKVFDRKFISPQIQRILRQRDGYRIMTKFSMFQTVRVVSLHSPKAWPVSSLHPPKIGDTGAIIGIFSQPRESYTVESVLPDGTTSWLADFSPEDLEAAP
jgi:hypothetical protein